LLVVERMVISGKAELALPVVDCPDADLVNVGKLFRGARPANAEAELREVAGDFHLRPQSNQMRNLIVMGIRPPVVGSVTYL